MICYLSFVLHHCRSLITSIIERIPGRVSVVLDTSILAHEYENWYYFRYSFD